MRTQLLMVAVALVAAGCGSDDDPTSDAESPSSTRSAAPTPSTASPEPAVNGRFRVSGGRELAIRCLGEGAPVIILEGGDGSGLEENAQLIGPLAEQSGTTTCTYDRSGTGSSDPPKERRRTLDDVSADLHDLVASADLPPPLVLVGPSSGGGLVVNYASRYPQQVAGLVLLDVAAPVPDLDKEFPGAQGWRNPMHLDFVAGSRQLALHPPSLGDIPLRVVTAAEGDSSAKDQSFWLDLSSRARRTTILGGHDLTSENPAGVIAEITSVVRAAARR